MTAYYPKVLELPRGTYWWCSCGKTKDSPWCDGSHRGTKFSPEKLILDRKKTLAFCQCKHSGQGALCDGTHIELKNA
ncbi:MAG: CDGSH iron-sulfur domain-containing protein [Bacteroidota bacterium]